MSNKTGIVATSQTVVHGAVREVAAARLIGGFYGSYWRVPGDTRWRVVDERVYAEPHEALEAAREHIRAENEVTR